MLAYHDRILLGHLLVDLDELINGLDRAVFEAAYHTRVGDLEAQRANAMDSSFQPPIKKTRDAKMLQRNVVAKLLGFEARKPHDMSPRDYIVHGSDRFLLPRGSM